MTEDRLRESLAALRTEAPAHLLDNVLVEVGVVDHYVERPGPIGSLFVAFGRSGITALEPAGDAEGFERRYREHTGHPVVRARDLPARLGQQLDRALGTGRLGSLPVDLSACGAFQQAVLRTVTSVPPGEVRPYSWIAREIGHPGAARAVGTALATNPVPVLVPCHRAVRADGRIGNYAFGSDVKRALLEAEGLDTAALEADAAAGRRYLGSATTRIVCHPTCREARRIAQANRRWFRTTDQATRAGFRPCRRCRPAAAAA